MTFQRQLAHVHRRFATTSLLVAPRTCQSQGSRARYQPDNQKNFDDDVLAGLVEQARQTPVVNIPGTVHAVESQQSPRQRRRGNNERLGKDHEDASSIEDVGNSSTRKATTRLPAQRLQQVQQQDLLQSFPQRRIRPSSMDFKAMYQQLAQWKSWYLTAHVPRFCFDAPELGAWVRNMRKQQKQGLLELWKVERLNALEMEWEVTDQDAKWHYKYHQLRRYLLLYGTTTVDPGSSSADYCDWMMIARWLTKQARLLAKRKLSGQKRAMLEQLGVTLRLPKRLVHRTAQLQALNGMERRKLRKKWKALDLEVAEQQRQQWRSEWERRRQQQRQQQWVVNRRLALLRSSQVVDGGSNTSAAATGSAQQQQQQQQLANLQDLLLKQQPLLDGVAQVQEQKHRQLAHHHQQWQPQGLPLQQQQRQQQQQLAGSRDTVQLQLQPQLLFEKRATDQPIEAPSGIADSGEGSAAGQSGDSLAVAGTAPAITAAETPEAGLEQQQQQQQQQQQEALFWRKNRRSRNMRQKSRQEKWLQVQQGGEQ